jgi:putative FmdB family regulatory protein
VPIYEYRCRNGHTFEVKQSMSDDAIATCQECGAPVERVFHPVAVHFKGSGFYTTDYGRTKRSHAADSGGSESKDSSDTASAKSDSKSEGSKDSKPESKSSGTTD